MRLRSIAVLALAVPALGQGYRFDRTFLPRALTRVECLVEDDGLSVQVRIDERGPFRFALDTNDPGDGQIDRRVARRLDLEGSSQVARVRDLSLSGARFEGLDLDLVDLQGSIYDGRLGMATFRDVLMRIDWRHRSMLLYRGELPADDSSMFVIDRERGSTVEGSIGGRRFLGQIDLGEPVGFDCAPGSPLSTSAGDLAVGSVELSDFPRSTALARARPVLGMRLLQYVVPTIDVRSRRIHFRRHTATRETERLRFDPTVSPVAPVKLASTGHLLVQPWINGALRGWMVMDTGASLIALHDQVAEAARLVDVGTTRVVTPTREHETRVWRADEVKMGPMTLRNVRLSGLERRRMRVAVDRAVGLMGGGFWRFGVIELDIVAGSVALHDPHRLHLPGVVWHEMELRNNVPFVDLAIEGHEGSYLLDTGDPGAITVFSPVVRRHDLLADRDLVAERHAEIGGEFELLGGWLRRATVLGHDLAEVPASFATAETGMFGSDLAAGSIGTALLESFTVLLDYPRSRIALLPRDRMVLPDVDLDALVGRYETSGRWAEVERVGDQLSLRLERGPARDLIAESVDEFRLRFGQGRCEFERDRKGRPTRLVLTRPAHPVWRLRRR